jgi:NAD(P)-dependent dehydrogenase (short-subunit alcohol dehydrogenase family)
MDEMKCKVCIITGSNSGIGKETALALAGMNATVVMAVRNQEKGEIAKKEISEKTENRMTDLMICDLASLTSIRNFAKEFAAKYDRLDVLINNAGVVMNNRQTTVDGFERNFAVDYLGPVLLTHELLPLLKSSAPSRIINLSSGLYKSGKIDFDDLQSEKHYNGMQAYRNAKLMILMFTYELARRLEGTGVTVNAVQPGFAATNLGRNTGSLLQAISYKLVRVIQISAKKGAETSVYLATSNEVKNVTGKCFRKMQVTETSPTSNDREMQKRLWEKTMELLHLPSI